ncbi:hypothetical protein SARC_11071 [Sphaeroforma arctica JP610]|uniref:Mitochondrial carrier protein n=1 Tax=Sphaeroforma arctica JP610 TaxID=667725 RepID=A0A0L0FIY3_9EUKA|nr:hypothetical protein SARC_11071 [Sphaeroforma arctica JP610]KNC76431.1 hypothetical protein SARC_11071 [Sphaeroforma arctica JP610]|eukprot:XP_014150333.1 hypothetical protein SARC_11071 [Sphaeroforma arctica JP610]
MIFVPLEVLKTRMQVQAMCSSRRHEPYVSLAHAVQNVLKNEGWKGFYRGYSATMFREIPYAAVFFLVYEEVKRHVFSRGYSPDTHQHETSQDTYEDTQSCENITSTVPPRDCVGRYPIEKSDGSNMGASPAVVRNLDEGTEWVGTGIGGDAVIHNGTDIQDNDTGNKNSLWNSYKQTADKIIINANKFSDSEGDQYSDVDASNNAYLRPDEAIVTGAVAGAVACTVTIPFDVVKTRSQLTLGAHVGLMRTGVQLVAKEGWLVLFSGLPARILYQSPQAAMMILMYEWASSISSQIFDGS